MPDTRPRPPSVERLLAAARPLLGERSHAAIVDAARDVIADERARLARNGSSPRAPDELAVELVNRLDRPTGPQTLINATGVIIHTNLGRAPWPPAAIEAAAAAVRDTLFLELDRSTGRRGRRYREAEEQLIALTGAEDALVTNNNAAAVALAVGLAGRGGGVAVSRGELVEIGGGVRIPEIVRRAGARLVEVGTTNKTRVDDFAEGLESGRVRMVLRVHPSNFRQEGFTEAPDMIVLAKVAHAHGAIVVDDLGSGALFDTAAYGLAHEPMPSERLASGADVVTFSGDKLVGGPQAGLLVGRSEFVGRIRKDPLARAMRPDKATLAGVAATLGLYRSGTATREIPVWQMIAAPHAEIRFRAEALARDIGGDVIELRSTVGGGSLPGETLPSWGIALAPRPADRLLTRLRTGDPAVVGRIQDGRVVLDLRTVSPEADGALAGAIRGANG